MSQQRQEKDQATVGCDETAPTTTAEEEPKVEDMHEPKKEVVSYDDDEEVIVDEINVDDDIEDSKVPPSRPPQPHLDDDDGLRKIKAASRLELAPAVYKGDEDCKPDGERSKNASKEKKTNEDDKFEDDRDGFISQKTRGRRNRRRHQDEEEIEDEEKSNDDGPKDKKALRGIRAANMLLPESEEEESEDEEDEEDRPGAIPIRGIGRSGMGPSPDEEEVTIVYSMGGPNNEETAAEEDRGNVQSSRTDEGNENLVEAVLAPEPPEIVVGTPMEEDENKDEEDSHRAWYKRWQTYLLVAVISIAAGLALWFTLPYNGKETEPTTSTMATEPTTAPTTAPTESPSTAPTNNITNTAISMLIPNIPDIPNSPMQLWALNWLVNNDDGMIDAQDSDRLLDRYVLAIFYNATNGDEWDDNTGWLSDVSTCYWNIGSGSLCPKIDGRVERIGFYDNNLQGFIPTEIGALSTLSYINLDGNYDTWGTIPTEIGSLTALTSLFLDFNGFSGSIPTEIGMLNELTYLSLDYNEHVGTIPTELGQLIALKSLDLSSNELVGTIPTELGQLTALTRLWLHYNELVGTIPTELGQLTALRSLYLEDNNLTGTIPTELVSFVSSLFGCNLGCQDGSDNSNNPGLVKIPDNCISYGC